MIISNKKICVITGGTGGIGISLANYLAKILYLDVIVLDKNITNKISEKVKVINCDLTLPECKKYFKNVDYIFHLACIKPSERGTTKEEYQKNIKMTENVARFNEKAKVIYPSAGTIYGICNKFPIKEDREVKCAENDWYCKGKLESENILKEYSEENGWELVILRITNVYGTDFKRKGEILPNFFEAMMNNELLQIFGDGKQKRDRIFIDDLIQALVLSMEYARYGTFNIGSGKSYSILEVAKMMSQNLGKPYKIELKDIIDSGRKDNLLDITKAKKVLGFKPKVSFKKGLKLVLNKWKNE